MQTWCWLGQYLGIAGLMTTAAAVVLHGCAVLLGAPLFS